MHLFKHFKAKNRSLKRVYLDYASSTPCDEDMLARIPTIPKDILSVNPSALHKEGVQLRRVVKEARARTAHALEVHPDEIIFTSGATESDNLAIAGAIHGFLKKGIAQNEIVIFSSELEHSAVAEIVKDETMRDVRHVVIVTPDGVVNPKDIVVPEHAKVVIVSVMYVNNEIGTVQPIVEIAKRVRQLRKLHPEVTFIFHTDATQAPLHFSLRVPTLGVDMMTLGATKLYCQKGVGMLYKKRGVMIEPIIRGGGQEFGLRPGTEPVALIHEFSHSLEYANSIKEKETARVLELQKYFESEIKKHFPSIQITAKDQPRTPHITHIAVPRLAGGRANFDSELLVLELDARGIAVSAKSACKNDLPRLASGKAGEEITEKLYGKGFGTVRFSFGRMTTKKELDKAIAALKSVFQKYKSF